MLISSTAVSFTQTQVNIQKLDKNVDENNYVDPNIELKKSLIPVLEYTLNNIEDVKFKEFLESIIFAIKTKGVVISEDIKEILLDLDMSSFNVCSGRVKGEAVCSDASNVRAFGLPFLVGVFLGSHWFGPGLFVNWVAKKEGISSENISFDICGRLVNSDHKGLAILFVGSWRFLSPYRVNPPLIYDYIRVNILSPLIIWENI